MNALTRIDEPTILAVTLTPGEVVSAASVGIYRAAESIAAGRRDAHGAKEEGGMFHHINGACAELAVAKAMGLPWTASIRSFKGPDVGSATQVRWRSKAYYELIVRQDDNPDHAYVLVQGTAPEMRILGWIRGREAQRPEWWKPWGGREHAWFVPHDALRPLRGRAA